MSGIEGIPIVQIGVIVLTSFLLGTIFARLGFSSAVGYIVGGLFLGPLGANYLAPEGVGIGTVAIFGDLGVMMLLFYLGLELNIKRFKQTGAIATILASIEMLFAFVMGYLVAKFFGFGDLEALVIGSMLTATSTVITSRFILEKKLIETAESRIVISVLILEDFLAILILVFVASIVDQKSLNILVINALLFVVAMFFLVSKVSKHVLNMLNSMGYEDQMWLYGIGVFITVAYFGNSYLGLTPALGAYFAGFALSESAYGNRIKKELGLFREFFVLFFFVSFGATATFPSNPMIYVMLVLLVIGYILAKLLSEVIFGTAVGLELKSAVTGGLLMGSVGEFALIIATSLGPLKLASGGDILSLAFMLTLTTTITMPILYSYREKITAFFERIYPFRLRRKGFLVDPLQAFEKISSDTAFQNEYLVSMKRLFGNLVIAISIVYLSYLVSAEIDLSFIPLIPPKLSSSLIILPLIIWPIYKFINELKFLTKRFTNAMLRQTFPTKNRNVAAIEREVGEIFSGTVLVLLGIGCTAFTYFHYPAEFLLMLIPGAYTVISIMYLSKSIYGLIEEYESLEEGLGDGTEITANTPIAKLSKEFNEHSKLLHNLTLQRNEVKEKIQDAIRTNDLLLAKQMFSSFKRQEGRALINIFDINTFRQYPRLRQMLETDINAGKSVGPKINEIGTKEAFVKYMQAHLKPQLYEMELERMGKDKKTVKKKRITD